MEVIVKLISSGRPGITRRTFTRLFGATVTAASSWGRLFGLERGIFGPYNVSSQGESGGLERGAVSNRWVENWEDGMVSGNGTMGVVAYGQPETPIFIFNHNQLYTS